MVGSNSRCHCRRRTDQSTHTPLTMTPLLLHKRQKTICSYLYRHFGLPSPSISGFVHPSFSLFSQASFEQTYNSTEVAPQFGQSRSDACLSFIDIAPLDAARPNTPSG